VSAAEESENHWPGYVDALTTMVMILIFVMMILSVAFFSASANTSRALVERIASTIGVNVSQPNVSGEEMADKLVDLLQNERKKGNTGTSASEAPPPAFNTQAAETIVRSQATAVADTSAGKVRIDSAETNLTVMFQPRATNVDADSLNEIETFIAATFGLPRPVYYQLTAYANMSAGGLSDSRRVAYYRAMFARQKLIAKGVDPKLISVRIEDSPREATNDKLNLRVLPGYGANGTEAPAATPPNAERR